MKYSLKFPLEMNHLCNETNLNLFNQFKNFQIQTLNPLLRCLALISDDRTDSYVDWRRQNRYITDTSFWFERQNSFGERQNRYITDNSFLIWTTEQIQIVTLMSDRTEQIQNRYYTLTDDDERSLSNTENRFDCCWSCC